MSLLNFWYLQKLCYNNIRNYESVNGITYQCTACNIAGSIYATFTGKVGKFPNLMAKFSQTMYVYIW